MAIVFDLPALSEEVVGRDGRMTDPWYRFFELFERALSGNGSELAQAIVAVASLTDLIAHAQALITNLQGSVEDIINVPITAGDGLTGGGSIVDGLTGGSLSFSVEGAEVGAASEAIAAYALVNIYDAGGGVFKVRNADADAGKPCHAFVRAAYANTETVTVHAFGVVTGQSGLIPGFVYLGTAPGSSTSTVPVTGKAQRVGVALSATSFAFLWQDPFDI